MKKIISILLSVLFCFAVTGCSKKAQATSPDNLYSITAEIEQGKFKGKATMSRLGNGAWDITFIEPETIKGLNLTYENGNVKMSYSGLEATIENEDKGILSCCTYITSVLDKLAYSSKELEFTENKDSIKAEGEKYDCDFTILFEKKTKKLKGLECDDKNLKVQFSDYKKVN